MATPPPPQPSRKEPLEGGRAEVEVTTDPNQKATHPLAPEKDREEGKGASANTKDFDQGPGPSHSLTPEMPQEPLAASDQPIPSNLSQGNADISSDSATPSVEKEGQPQPEPSFKEPTPDDEEPGQIERSQPLIDQDDDSDIGVPEAGFPDPNRQTEPEQEAEETGLKEAAEEEGGKREEPGEGPSSDFEGSKREEPGESPSSDFEGGKREEPGESPSSDFEGGKREEPGEDPSSDVPEEPRVMAKKGEFGTTPVPTISKQSEVNRLQSEFPPKLTFALGGNTGTEREQLIDTDDQGLTDEIRILSTMKTREQSTRNLEDSEHPTVRGLELAERSRTDAIEMSITRTVPVEFRTPVLGIPMTRSPSIRAKSLVDSKTNSNDLSQDGKQEEEDAFSKEGRRNIGVTQQIPDTTRLPDGFPDLTSVLLSKTPKRTALNQVQRSADSRNAAQPPTANESSVARAISVDGMSKNRVNPSTDGDKQSSGRTLAIRTRLEMPSTRLAKSDQDYRRPSFCSLHKVRGHCTEHLPRWYFNPFNGSCQSFTYSGCGGNPNNFETMDTCIATCTGRNTDRSHPSNNLQADAPTVRMPTRFPDPDWMPVSPSMREELPPRQPDGLRFFLDALRGRLPPPPPPPPPFLRSMAYLPLRSSGPGDNAADQKMSPGDTYDLESVEPEEGQRRAKQSSEKGFHLSGKASRDEPRGQLQRQRLHQPLVQRSRSSEFYRATSNLPEKATIKESDVSTLRHLLQQNSKEHPVSAFDPMPPGRNLGTSSVHKSRSTVYSESRKADDTGATKRVEMDQPHFEGRLPVVQRIRSRQNRQSPPAVGFQRFGHSVYNGHHLPQELQNFRWIEQAIMVSDLEPQRLHLPIWFDEEMMEKSRPPGQIQSWRDPNGPRRPDGNSGSPQNALTLRRNSMIIETRQRVRKPQDLERERGVGNRAPYPAQERVRKAQDLEREQGVGNRVSFSGQAMPPNRISLNRSLPRQTQKQPRPTFSSSSSHSSPARGRGNSEIPFHVLHPNRPLVDQLAGRTGADRADQYSRRPSQAEAEGLRIGGRGEHRGERPTVMGRDKNWQGQDQERQVQRRRNNNGFPTDRLTFLQIFVNRDTHGPDNQPHFPKPSLEEKQYLSQSTSRHQIEAPQFQTNQHGGNFPPLPPPRQMSQRQRPYEISRETMTDERDWFHASEFDDGPPPNGEVGNARSGFIGPVPSESSKDDRRGNQIPFVCQLPLDPGSCAGYQAKWFYDRRMGSCELFYYGGCSGNGNRFETRDECLQTCDGDIGLKTDETEPRSLEDSFGRQASEISRDEVVILTSPVYKEEEDVKDTATVKVRYTGHNDHVGRLMMTTHAPFLSGHGKRMEEEEELEVQVDAKATEGTTTEGKSAVTDLAGKVGDAEAKKDDDLSKTFSTQYIAIVTALGVVGIAVVLMVILSIVRLCRRVKKSKREHCIQEVIKSHMYGDLPHVLYSESPSSAASEKEKSDKK